MSAERQGPSRMSGPTPFARDATGRLFSYEDRFPKPPGYAIPYGSGGPLPDSPSAMPTGITTRGYSPSGYSPTGYSPHHPPGYLPHSQRAARFYLDTQVQAPADMARRQDGGASEDAWREFREVLNVTEYHLYQWFLKCYWERGNYDRRACVEAIEHFVQNEFYRTGHGLPPRPSWYVRDPTPTLRDPTPTLRDPTPTLRVEPPLDDTRTGDDQWVASGRTGDRHTDQWAASGRTDEESSHDNDGDRCAFQDLTPQDKDVVGKQQPPVDSGNAKSRSSRVVAVHTISPSESYPVSFMPRQLNVVEAGVHQLGFRIQYATDFIMPEEAKSTMACAPQLLEVVVTDGENEKGEPTCRIGDVVELQSKRACVVLIHPAKSVAVSKAYQWFLQRMAQICGSSTEHCGLCVMENLPEDRNWVPYRVQSAEKFCFVCLAGEVIVRVDTAKTPVRPGFIMIYNGMSKLGGWVVEIAKPGSTVVYATFKA